MFKLNVVRVCIEPCANIFDKQPFNFYQYETRSVSHSLPFTYANKTLEIRILFVYIPFLRATRYKHACMIIILLTNNKE